MKKREAMNRRLKEQSKQLGIFTCEIQIPGLCVHSVMLTWAHALKSRYLVSDEDWMRAALCCIPCHNYIEALSHEDMRIRVDDAIARRPKPARPALTVAAAPLDQREWA